MRSLRLTFSGTDLWRADNPQQIEALYRSCFGGDTLKYRHHSRVYTPTGPLKDVMAEYVGHCYCIPLVYDGCNAIRGKLLENCVSYGGSALELTFSIDSTMQREKHTIAAPFLRTNESVEGAASAATKYTLSVGYVMSSILEVSSGSSDLQL